MSNGGRSFILGPRRITLGPGLTPRGHADGPMRALLLFILLLGAAQPAAGTEPRRWQPPGLLPSAASVSTILARVPQLPTRGFERYRFTRGSQAVMMTLERSGTDYRAKTTIDGFAYENGRSGGHRWSRGPNGAMTLDGPDGN